jgi:DNA ligase (NAD+)
VVADAVVARELVREPLDLMEIQTKFQQLVSLNLGTDDEPRVLGEKNATKIVEALKKSRDLPLSRWLFALGIPEVGEINAYKVSAIHKTIEEIAHSAILKDITDLYGKKAERERINPGSRLNPPKTDKEKAERQARADQLDKEIAKIEERLRSFDIKDVGPVVAESILSFFASPQGKEVLARFKKLELAPKGGATAGTASDQATASAVSGKTVVLTGELDSMSREKATELIRARGGSVTGSVSRKTSFVVAGHDPGANKMDDAKQFGITVINEQQFLDMLGPIPTSAPPPPSSPLQQDLFSQSPKAARRRKPK